MSPWSEESDSYYELCGNLEKMVYIIKKFRQLNLTDSLMFKFKNKNDFWDYQAKRIKKYFVKFHNEDENLKI